MGSFRVETRYPSMPVGIPVTEVYPRRTLSHDRDLHNYNLPLAACRLVLHQVKNAVITARCIAKARPVCTGKAPDRIGQTREGSGVRVAGGDESGRKWGSGWWNCFWTGSMTLSEGEL